MKITPENLIKAGFIKRERRNLSFYIKGNFGIVYNYNLWLICNCETGTPLINKRYVSTMEDVFKSYDEYQAYLSSNSNISA